MKLVSSRNISGVAFDGTPSDLGTPYTPPVGDTTITISSGNVGIPTPNVSYKLNVVGVRNGWWRGWVELFFSWNSTLNRYYNFTHHISAPVSTSTTTTISKSSTISPTTTTISWVCKSQMFKSSRIIYFRISKCFRHF